MKTQTCKVTSNISAMCLYHRRRKLRNNKYHPLIKKTALSRQRRRKSKHQIVKLHSTPLAISALLEPTLLQFTTHLFFTHFVDW